MAAPTRDISARPVRTPRLNRLAIVLAAAVAVLLAGLVGIAFYLKNTGPQPPFTDTDARASYRLEVTLTGAGDSTKIDQIASKLIPDHALTVPKVNLGGSYVSGTINISVPRTDTKAKWALMVIDNATNRMLNGYALADGTPYEPAWNEKWTAPLADRYDWLRTTLTKNGSRLGSSNARALLFPVNVSRASFMVTQIPLQVDGADKPVPITTPADPNQVSLALALVDGDTVFWAAKVK